MVIIFVTGLNISSESNSYIVERILELRVELYISPLVHLDYALFCKPIALVPTRLLHCFLQTFSRTSVPSFHNYSKEIECINSTLNPLILEKSSLKSFYVHSKEILLKLWLWTLKARHHLLQITHRISG